MSGLIGRLLPIIGHRPDPVARPWLWYVGRAHGSVLYPHAHAHAFRPRLHISRRGLRLLVVKVCITGAMILWDRDRAAIWERS